MAMLHYCESHPRSSKDGVILVLNDSRFGRFRDVREAGHWQFVFAELGWEVRFCEGDEIPDGTARTIMRVIGSAQASEYRENLRNTQRRASRAVAETGRWRCEAPLGYRRLATRTDGAQRVLEIGKRKADDEIVRLTLGPDSEQELIQWMFETYASGSISLYHLALAAQEKAPGLRSWKTQVVRMMLLNPAYVGDVVHGRKPASEDGSQRVERERDKWLVVKDAHPAIVTRELFQAVQEIMREHKTLTRASNGDYLLSGLLRCSCGRGYHGGGGSRGPSNDPGRWLFYRCGGADRQIGTCRPPLVCVNQRWIEGIVIETLSDIITHPSTIELIRETAYSLSRDDRKGGRSNAQALTKERDRLIAQRKRIVDSIAREVVQESEASASLAEIRSRIASIEAEQSRVAVSKRSSATVEREAEQLICRALEFPKVARSLPPAILRRLIEPWIEQLSIEKESRTLTLVVNRVPEIVNMDHRKETSAGARFTVIRRGGSVNPEFTRAALTRSLLSLTAPAGSPTISHCGNPGAASTSTITSYASMPTTAADRIAASIPSPWLHQPR
jgi:hypothetical protein